MHDLEHDTVLKTNALDKAISRCLSQKGDNSLLYPVAYYSWKLLLAKLNYDVYDKELLAIVNAIEH